MPWPRRLNANGRKLLQQNRGLQSQLLRLGEQLRDNKNRYRGLELVLRQRMERIDELANVVATLRDQNRRLDEEAERLAEMVRLSP